MATKQKMVSRSKLNINGVIKEIVDHGNVDIVSVQENLDTQPQELTEGECIDINEERGCDKKDDDIPDKMTLANHSYYRAPRRFLQLLKWKE